MNEPTTSVSPLHVREVSDRAVRRLAVSSDSLQERLRAAGAALLEGISRADFPAGEDRDLFDQIQLGLLELDLVGDSGTSTEAISADALESLAGAILDLRDTIMGHAIREAQMATARQSPPMQS